MLRCPLCSNQNVFIFYSDKGHEYYRCNICCLVFLNPESRLSKAEEKSRYGFHQNNPDDLDYRHFLSQLLNPMKNKIPVNSKGLDFGCGPGPTLSVMFEELGYEMEIYDSLFFPNKNNLGKEYDFISSSEAVEHFYFPLKEFLWMFNMLRKEGWLGIMTSFFSDDIVFGDWHYIRDDTHVCFYSKKTFKWISRYFNAPLEFYGNSVVLLQKP